MQIARTQASIAGPLFQAHKKLHEGEHLPEASRAVKEFLGAINYIAFAILLAEESFGFPVRDGEDMAENLTVGGGK
jgi:hypothetical protein